MTYYRQNLITEEREEIECGDWFDAVAQQYGEFMAAAWVDEPGRVVLIGGWWEYQTEAPPVDEVF